MGTTFFRFVTVHAFDRRTDRQKAFSRLDRAGILFSEVKCARTGYAGIKNEVIAIPTPFQLDCQAMAI